ncbi:MAG: hypothetical protein KDE24_13990, partial [Caldilinea sp.]|nr:hypothetical protein [Caldilinea sp.]
MPYTMLIGGEGWCQHGPAETAANRLWTATKRASSCAQASTWEANIDREVRTQKDPLCRNVPATAAAPGSKAGSVGAGKFAV